MTTRSPEIKFSVFLYITGWGYFVFGIPTIIGILLLGLKSVKSLIFIFIPIALISLPLTAAISWLIAKGSNWLNADKTIIAACSVPGRFFGVFLGGLLGYHYFKEIGGIIFAILFYFLYLAISFPLGKFLFSKVICKELSH
jgi:hypothetical protein